MNPVEKHISKISAMLAVPSPLAGRQRQSSVFQEQELSLAGISRRWRRQVQGLYRVSCLLGDLAISWAGDPGTYFPSPGWS